MSAPAELPLGGTFSAREGALWSGAAVAVLLAHAAFALAFQVLSPTEQPPEASEQALMIDLAPIPISAPQAVSSESIGEDKPTERLLPEEETEEQSAEETQTIADATPDTVEASRPDEVVTEEPEKATPDAVQPEMAEPVSEATPVETTAPEPEMVEEQVVEAEKPEVVLPKPEPKPEVKKEEPRKQPAKKAEVKKTEKPAKKNDTPKKSETPKSTKAEQTAEKPAKSKSASAAAASSKASKAPSVNPARWHNAVRAAVARRVGRVRGMRGTVRIQFVVSSAGSVLSASIAGSSGNPKLDSAAIKMVRSARVPAAPAGLSGSQHSFAIPVTFH